MNTKVISVVEPFDSHFTSLDLMNLNGRRPMLNGSKRVMVAEDEYLIRLVVVDDLLAAGYEVVEAGDGLDAIQMLDTAGHIDVLVTNIRMPGADGLKVAAAARACNPNIPIIFISSTPDMVGSNASLSPYECLAKPFQTSDLVSLVQKLSMGVQDGKPSVV